MKAKTKHLTDQITAALGPIFHANPDYKTITEAIALTVARVAQSTPDKGNEEEELEIIMQIAANALNVFLNEEAAYEARQKIISKGLDAFAEMARSDEPISGGVPPKTSSEAKRLSEQNLEESEYNEGSCSSSPVHEEIARFEQEHSKRHNGCDDGHNPDGPRAYAP